jgi:hypothetical protein
MRAPSHEPRSSGRNLLIAVILVVLAGVITDSLRLQAQQPSPVQLTNPQTFTNAEFTLASSIRERSDGTVLVADLRENRLNLLDWTRGRTSAVGRMAAQDTAAALRTSVSFGARVARLFGRSSAGGRSTVGWSESRGVATPVIRRSFDLAAGSLDRGEHRITLTVRRADGLTASAERHVRIR